MEANIPTLELRLTLRLGGMIVAGMAIIAVTTRLQRTISETVSPY